MADLSASLIGTAAARAAAVSPADKPVGGVGDYVALLKPRVMSLVVFTGWAGLYLAPGHVNPFLGFVAVLCIAVAAGASGAINMWYDRDIDAVMERTKDRPIPAGRIAAGDALGFGVILAVGSVVMMALALNVVAGLLLAMTIAFYVFIYTIWLKRLTPQNIVIGGAAGAFPPIVGWAAATGEIGWLSIVLFALIFFWTPPHFWALSLYRTGDYAKAGVPMLPVVAGARETKKQMLLYTVALWPVAVAPTLLHAASWFYGAPALALSAVFTLCSIGVMRDPGDTAAKRMFHFSLLYLFLLFALLVADRALGFAVTS
ncbi:MAG TPA: heme o synthase [Stellaceae bacterium]|jgi:protoheme IX farnesyltransferase|nr:heme o synthase [Stellaceae bacterium]